MKTHGILTLSDAREHTEDVRGQPKFDDATRLTGVVVTGVRMGFGSMVGLALKWGLASLVAAGILAAVLGIIYLGGTLIMGSIGGGAGLR